MVFVSRPLRLDHLQPGRAVNDLDVKTNSFSMDFPRNVIHHYDVIEPLYEAKNPRPIGSRKGNELVMRLQSQNSDTFVKRAAFDGKKNLFAPVMYFPSRNFEVLLNENERPRRDKEPRKVRIYMTHVNAIDFGILQQYLRTQQHSDKFQNEVNLMTNMLNVLVNAVPKQKEGVLATSKSIFVQSERRAIDSIAPLELWRGYYQSVRPAFDRMIVNVDVTIGVILPADKLEHICAAYLHLRNLQDLRRLRPDQFQKLRHFLRSIKVTVETQVHKNRPAKAIRDLIQDASGLTFDKNGTTVTVAQHFLEAHNLQIPPSTLGVRFDRSDSVFPITVCKTIQQFYKNRATPEVVRAALEFTPPNPNARADEITKAFRHLDYQNSGFLVNAGINIDQRPQMVKGRLLARPNIIFNGTVKNLNARPGVWDVMSQKLAKPATITTWLLINFAQVDDQSLRYFVDELIKAMRSLGISVSGPVALEHRSAQTDIDRELGTLVKQHRPTLILAILPDPAEEQYRKIKRFGDIRQGVATQCVRWSFNLKKNVGQRRVNQYQNNLILKINPKMGGTNFYAGSSVLQQMGKAPFMVIGADVSHPGPGSQMPSVASLVASYDREACRYAASVKVQSSRVEMIENFESMFKELLDIFEQRNRVLPKNIYIFRDGVSEGEFLNVGKFEKTALDAVFKSKYPPDGQPRILYVVVGKRHHIRFFPENRGADPKGNGNFPSGLVVDDNIVHPRFCDFYLQSQPGLKGTSIPSHYTIIRNDIGIPVANIQELAYALCHCYSRSTRSVKIPAPVYYADLVCRRAKFHYNDAINNYSASSVSGDDDMGAHLDFYRSNFDSVNSNMRQQMYYV